MRDRMISRNPGSVPIADIKDQALAQTANQLKRGRRYLNRARQATEDFVLTHPAVCLGAAIGAGILFGWWVKRK